MFMTTAAAAAAAHAAPPVRSSMGFSPDCFVIARPSRNVLDYIQYAYDRGAGGVQGLLASLEPDYLRNIRSLCEKLGMYLEISVRLPEDDSDTFAKHMAAAREAGAHCLRSVCLSGRRYETFNTLADFQAFAKESKIRLTRAVRVADKLKFPIGLENHKDWTIDEMVPLLKSYDSEYLGACIDWGNNISLLDDPMELAERLAPFSINSHIKEMAVEEYADGFLLAEVPLGQGMMPLKQMLSVILAARPKTRISLDLLTRNPLLIPCYTEKYWATFPDRNGVYLARTMRMVKANKPKKPLVYMEKLTAEQRLQFEQDNVRQSVEYARDGLGLKI
jgi:3-oxoisoapionate decarboxylase